MQTNPAIDPECRLQRAVEQYKQRIAEAERLLRAEVDVYSAEMARRMAFDAAAEHVESRSWVQ